MNDTYKGLGWVFVPVRRGKSISRKQDRPPNLLFQHSTEIIITCPKKRKIYQCNGGTWIKMMLVCTYIGGRKGLNTHSLVMFGLCKTLYMDGSILSDFHYVSISDPSQSVEITLWWSTWWLWLPWWPTWRWTWRLTWSLAGGGGGCRNN